jgi:tRNA threonylcarbamoyl adenosine modification protein (Sua5/YciO/YrdC/YwlC family)
MEKMKLVDQEQLNLIARAIKNSKVVAFPSDTCYGLAVAIDDTKAISELYKIKSRDSNKKISYIFSDISQIEKWAKVSAWQKVILATNLPGPFTFVLSTNESGATYSTVVDANKTIGARIPDFWFTKKLSFTLGKPYSATSANLSQHPECYSSQDVLNEFSGKMFKPDIVVDFGVLKPNPPSGVYDLRGDKIICLRKGAKDLNIP